MGLLNNVVAMILVGWTVGLPREVLQEPRRASGPLDALPGDMPPRSSTGDSAGVTGNGQRTVISLSTSYKPVFSTEDDIGDRKTGSYVR